MIKGDKIPYIKQETIECNLQQFTRWLNDIVDQLNWVIEELETLKETAEDHDSRIKALENQTGTSAEEITVIQDSLLSLDNRLTEVEHSGSAEAINMVNGRVDFLYNLLPVPYGMIEPKGWKFAMGNINVMTGNNGTPSTLATGIFTRDNIADNDVYFN